MGDWRAAGFYETQAHRQIGRAVHGGIGSGRLIAVTGAAGVGKTVFLHRPQDETEKERKVIVARSLPSVSIAPSAASRASPRSR